MCKVKGWKFEVDTLPVVYWMAHWICRKIKAIKGRGEDQTLGDMKVWLRSSISSSNISPMPPLTGDGDAAAVAAASDSIVIPWSTS